MEVSGQLHATVALPPGKEDRSLGRTPEPFWTQCRCPE